MNQPQQMTRSRFVFGLLFVALGVLLLVERAGGASAWAVVADWWPAILIASGVAQVVTRPRNPLGATLLVLTGGVLLAWTLGVVGAVGLLWPALLIAIGTWLVAGRSGPRSGDTVGRIELSAVVDDRTVSLGIGEVTDGSVTSLLGDATLDLRQAVLRHEGATLHTTAILGDVRLDVPDVWRVHVSGPELFGDVIHERTAEPPVDAPVLRLRVLTVFGDITVRSHPRVPDGPASIVTGTAEIL